MNEYHRVMETVSGEGYEDITSWELDIPNAARSSITFDLYGCSQHWHDFRE
ncbi:hypothetical protein Mapa_015934 [Marchantia paleacea]|nr:hypothetical protein Mapa_015934 [Marchantia paleacea]